MKASATQLTCNATPLLVMAPAGPCIRHSDANRDHGSGSFRLSARRPTPDAPLRDCLCTDKQLTDTTSMQNNTPPTTPQRRQQRTRQALRDLSLNVDSSPRRRRIPAPRPETPTPTGSRSENARSRIRDSHRAARQLDLQVTPRRRQRVSNENAAPNNLGISNGSHQRTVLPLPRHSYETPPLTQNISTQQSEPQIPVRRSTVSPARTPSTSPVAQNNRSLAQRRRRARERAERDGLRLEPAPQASTSPSLSNRALAQRRRRAREQEARQVATPSAQPTPRVRSTAHNNTPPHQYLPTPPTTQVPHDAAVSGSARANAAHSESESESSASDDDDNLDVEEQPPQQIHVGQVQQAKQRAPAPRRRRNTTRNRFLLARKPYIEPQDRHYLGAFNIVCPDCGALHWVGEKLSSSKKSDPRFSLCCFQGRVQLPPLADPPEPLRSLLAEGSNEAKLFRDHSIQYNQALAFTSIGVEEDEKVSKHPVNGQPVFKICGQLCHWIGALVPNPGKKGTYAQLYIYDPQTALQRRMEENGNLSRSTMEGLQQMLRDHHFYADTLKHAYEILQEYDGPVENAQVLLQLKPGLDTRRYNLPSAEEVAVILPGSGQARQPRDIILRNRGGWLQQISELHPAYAPLQYPLLFPYGENGWYPELSLSETDAQRSRRLMDTQQRRQRRQPHLQNDQEPDADNNNSRRLTLCRYSAFRIHFRPNQFNTLLRGSRLYTQYVVDMYAAIDQQRLRYLAENQSKIRAAHFNGLEDAMADDPDNVDLNELGQRVILPSSYIGGPRNMTQRFQDAMAIARFFRMVDLFITMTTNPKWREILEALLPGQTAYDRPDIVARVFHLKKDALIEKIVKGKIFGEVAAYVYTIEFQKRGLPHMHLLLFLKEPHKVTTPDAVDSCISAQWPDPETQPLLFKTVKERMVHGPCGALNPRAPCMVNGKCSKGFPKAYQPTTSMDRNGYPLYARPDDGRKYLVDGHWLDCQWLVPYCPAVSADFDCHINVECAVGVGSIKYPFKYVYKGPDRALMEVQRRNEIRRWIDGRYISPPEAAWRIFQFEMHEQVPTVVRLQVHLENHHMVAFDPSDNIESILERGAQQRTTLTAWFEANKDNGALGEKARMYTYPEFPQHFTWDKDAKVWNIRKQKRRFALGRMYFLKPTAGEQFYLRTLLTVVKGATCWEDLRRVPGYLQPFPTYHAACIARGLLEDDGEWRLCLEEASSIRTGTQLRHLFATILLFSDVSQPEVLWNDFRHHICDDLERQLIARNINAPTEEEVYDYGLFLLDKILRESGQSLANWPSMPLPTRDWTHLVENPLIAEQLNYNHELLQENLASALPRLNAEQRRAYDAIVKSVENKSGTTFFLNGPGGTGKTFVYNTVCAKLRSENRIVLCVSSSGISALLLQGGRTAHSMFKIPIDLDDTSVCAIPKQSQRADLLRETSAIIWDEISAQHRYAVEALHRTLQDIRNDDRPFGGVTVVLGGDFMQTLPVVPRGSRTDIVDATLLRSSLWDRVTVLKLHQNMRLQGADERTQQFARWLLDVGHGRNQVDENHVKFPEDMRVNSVESLIAHIYPGIDTPETPPPAYFLKRMILAPRNADVGEMNNEILSRMPGAERTYISADQVVHEAGADPSDDEPIPVEYLRAINSSSLPPGELRLKLGCPVILLRNLSPVNGLCNGTRMIITHLGDRVLEVTLLGGERHGHKALIPRISLTPTTNTDVVFKFRRRQFPVRLAFALSINKAQGQSVEHVGLLLHMPVFAHGQLYVALSRVTSPDNIRIYIPENCAEPHTTNVVYKEVLLD